MRRDVLRQVRDLAPGHPLTYSEALVLAERQASLLLELTGTSHPAVSDRVITELPRIEVRRMTPFLTSGASHFSRGVWRIALNATEPTTRQRFSLAHEFKHIIDHRDVDVLYRDLPREQRQLLIERVCDHFAGSLLMPRAWIERTMARGIRDPIQLAQVFNTSPSAMNVRLTQLGLIRPTPRCAPRASTWPGAPPAYVRSHARHELITN